MDEYLTVKEDSLAEIVIDRSRFIAVLKHIETEEQAAQFLALKRSEHYNARHNVYAYRLSGGEARFSDDGEPHSTAGKPVMDVISGAGLYDVMIVVTRYFGGILLGTGGLVRAYSSSAQKAVGAANIVRMTECAFMSINCEYPYLEPLRSFLQGENCSIGNIEYSNSVKLNFSVENCRKDYLIDRITDAFSGRITVNVEKTEFSAI